MESFSLHCDVWRVQTLSMWRAFGHAIHFEASNVDDTIIVFVLCDETSCLYHMDDHARRSYSFVHYRFVLFPLQHKAVWEMYKKAEASFWTAEEGKMR